MKCDSKSLLKTDNKIFYEENEMNDSGINLSGNSARTTPSLSGKEDAIYFDEEESHLGEVNNASQQQTIQSPHSESGYISDQV